MNESQTFWRVIMLVLVLLLAGAVFQPVSFAQNFHATPLTDFKPGQSYLGTFQGNLYENNSNNPPADHDADGRATAAAILPIGGKIVVVGIGMSNWTDELCDGSYLHCSNIAFVQQAELNRAINDGSLVIVDCAQGSHDAREWVDDSFQSYSTCRQRLSSLGLTEDQVQVVLWKDADAFPKLSLTSTTVCSRDLAVDACNYENLVGQVARYVKQRYPNVQQMFLHSRIYAGYATANLNPEPFAYEYGFATKWLIQAQINQRRGKGIDPVAGDLDYNVAPWLAWGAYFWASGDIPRSDGTVWLPSDYNPKDFTHPGPAAVTKVSNMMVNFFLSSPYSSWFRTGRK